MTLKFKIIEIYFIVGNVQLKYIHIYWGCLWIKMLIECFAVPKILWSQYQKLFQMRIVILHYRFCNVQLIVFRTA